MRPHVMQAVEFDYVLLWCTL